MTLANTVGRKIRELREKHGLSQSQLATAAKTSQVTLSLIESGKTATNLELLERIAKQLDVAPAELLSEVNPLLKRISRLSPKQRKMLENALDVIEEPDSLNSESEQDLDQSSEE